ncbi:MAG TPA: hypothetical protein VED00_01820 [archaeon]|nr:hypothetical protein [archaeon]
MNNGKPFCRWADDDCQGPTCTYASCIRGRLLANGTCAASLKRRTLEEKGPEEEQPSLKLKGKILRKISDDELF